MKLLTLSVSVFLVFQRAFHRASNTIDNFLWKRDQRPLPLQLYVSVILNGFDKTFFHGFILKETDVMFSHGTFASATVITFYQRGKFLCGIRHNSNPVVLLFSL